MIFKKLKREFPQFANLQANRVSELAYKQKVQIAKAIYHSKRYSDHIEAQPVRDELTIFDGDNYRTYPTLPNDILSKALYRALKVYYNE